MSNNLPPFTSVVMSLIKLRGPVKQRASIWVPTVMVMRVEDLPHEISLPVLNSTGCYAAIGLPNASDQRPYVMCGEGKNVGHRLMRKINDSDRAWHFVIIFGCEQPGWFEAAGKHLEWRFNSLLEHAPHLDLVIGVSPRRNHVSEEERRVLDNYVVEARRLLVSMGHHFLEPVPVLEREAVPHTVAPAASRFDFSEFLKPSRLSSTPDPMMPQGPFTHSTGLDGERGPGLKAEDPIGTRYRLHYGDLQATAEKLPDGTLLVHKGSEVSAVETTTLPRYIREHRATLLATGVLNAHPTDETKLVVTRDEPFESPSRLAKCLTGSTQGAGAVLRTCTIDTFRLI
ncbi:hypothetical protein DC522_23995 [Microvirga sp. KLBC 81]|uniref:hypothetical protein n=1 Tax=Microvirga sp. KLBC 81 TaxID=1862707 RepID=UPI000D512912|nr:hypothetical protein [Microvirga sp. KLBC 81]PVE21929.1 hypothetical protein DC522_23995 [Microvirga sp. KLBC 81]